MGIRRVLFGAMICIPLLLLLIGNVANAISVPFFVNALRPDPPSIIKPPESAENSISIYPLIDKNYGKAPFNHSFTIINNGDSTDTVLVNITKMTLCPENTIVKLYNSSTCFGDTLPLQHNITLLPGAAKSYCVSVPACPRPRYGNGVIIEACSSNNPGVCAVRLALALLVA